MPITVSAVIPVYAGERYLQALVKELEALRDAWVAQGAPLTLKSAVFVDDNAIDGSSALLDRIAKGKDWVKVIHLSRNYGQHPATVAGILETDADWVVTLDEDLQHPPAQVPTLLRQAVMSGADVVYAKPEGRIHEAASRDVTSRSFKRLIEWLTDNPHVRNFNSFRLIRGPIARRAAEACAHDTYFDIALYWFTQRIQSIVMPLKDQRYIETSKSGYNLRSLLAHARRLTVSSELKILRIAVAAGLFFASLSLAAMIAILLLKWIAPTAVLVRGWASQMLAIAFFGGLNLLLTGIALEFISILLQRSNGKPLFFVINRESDDVVARYFKQIDETRPQPAGAN